MPENTNWQDETWWGRFVEGSRQHEACWKVHDIEIANTTRMYEGGAQIKVNKVSGPRINGKPLRRAMFKIYRGGEAEYLKRTETVVNNCGDQLCLNPWHAVVQDKQDAVRQTYPGRPRSRERALVRAERSNIDWDEKSSAWLWRYCFLAAWLEYAGKCPDIYDVYRTIKVGSEALQIELSREELYFLAESLVWKPGVKNPEIQRCPFMEMFPKYIVFRMLDEIDHDVTYLWNCVTMRAGPGYNATQIGHLKDILQEFKEMEEAESNGET